MGAHQDGAQVHVETIEQWRTWLIDNHTHADGVWLVSWKTATGRPRISYEESVLEALTVGWIDSLANTLDDERSMLWFSPRRPTSAWSRPNKERIAMLEREGRMLPGAAPVSRWRRPTDPGQRWTTSRTWWCPTTWRRP